MDVTNFFLEVAKLTIPAVAVGGTVVFILKSFIKEEDKKRTYELRLTHNKTTLPLRLQAYERLTLFLERITVGNLILRLKQPGMTAEDLHSSILQNLREELEHNLTQQIYVTHDAWMVITAAKEQTAKIANISLAKVGYKATAMEYSKTMIEMTMQEEKGATYVALLTVKREAADLL